VVSLDKVRQAVVNLFIKVFNYSVNQVKLKVKSVNKVVKSPLYSVQAYMKGDITRLTVANMGCYRTVRVLPNPYNSYLAFQWVVRWAAG